MDEVNYLRLVMHYNSAIFFNEPMKYSLNAISSSHINGMEDEDKGSRPTMDMCNLPNKEEFFLSVNIVV